MGRRTGRRLDLPSRNTATYLRLTESEHWGCTTDPNANIGTIRTYPAPAGGTCIHLGPGNPHVHMEVGIPKVIIK